MYALILMAILMPQSGNSALFTNVRHLDSSVRELETRVGALEKKLQQMEAAGLPRPAAREAVDSEKLDGAAKRLARLQQLVNQGDAPGVKKLLTALYQGEQQIDIQLNIQLKPQATRTR